MPAGLSHLHRRGAVGTGPPLHRVGSRAGASTQPRRRRLGVRLRAPHDARRGRCRRARGAAPTRPRLGGALPAVQRARGGQRRRGHGVLSLRATRLAERGRRRSGALRHLGARVPWRERGSRGALATHADRDVDARSQAIRRCPLPHRRALGDGGRVAPAAQTLVAHEPRPPSPGGGHDCAVAGRRIPALPDPARNAARRRPRRRRRSRPTASGSLPTC